MSKIDFCLWFDDKAEEAAEFYTSVFKDARIITTTHYGPEAAKASGQREGSVMTVSFDIEGQRFLALNGGPAFKFTEAISLMLNCETQAELDAMWNALSSGGSTSMCGWLKDKFGLSWQIVPTTWDEMMTRQGANHEQKLNKAMEALYQMKKIDVQVLEDAYNQG